MKTRLLLLIFLLIAFAPECFSQFSFGVCPGIGFNSAHFGYRFNDKFVPYIGFQYLGGKFKTEESGQEYDYDLSRVVTYLDKAEISAGLYLPAIGMKYFVKQQNKLNAYLAFALTKPFVSGKMKVGKEEEDEIKDIIKNLNKSMWGYEIGMGVEYFVDENFSIGGEFGLRHMHVGYSDSYEDEFYNPDTGDYMSTTIENKIKLNGSPTYSRISLNYYF